MRSPGLELRLDKLKACSVSKSRSENICPQIKYLVYKNVWNNGAAVGRWSGSSTHRKVSGRSPDPAAACRSILGQDTEP